VVGKDELVARAWPQTFVEESNLKIQVCALRRTLGDGQGGHRYIITVPGRSYNFVAPLRHEDEAARDAQQLGREARVFLVERTVAAGIF
jgi:DNA-binding winged helix-turn-helix (wHTH) protein